MKSRNRRKIKGIELGFENVTVQFIPYEYIESLFYGGLKTTVTRPWGWKDTLSEEVSCDSFLVRLSSKMKDMKYDFFQDLSTCENDTVFERVVKGKDLVSVDLVYKDGKKDHIYIPWEDDNGDEETNGLLKIWFDDGDMIIESKRKWITD